MIRILDIARQAGVSVSTVSRVINENRYVHAATRRQVLALIEKNGYVPNKAARNMVLQRSCTIGIIISGETFNSFRYSLFFAVESRLRSLGYNTVFFLIKPGIDERDCLYRVKSEQPEGIIMFCEIKDPGFYEYLSRMNIPVVSTLFGNGFHTVMIDDEQAVFEAVSHLIRLGHRNINMICKVCPLEDKYLRGYCRALNEKGIAFDQERIVCERQCAFEDGKHGMKNMLLGGKDFSAVFVTGDEMAIGAMRVLKDKGIRVPEDISIVGFGDIETSDAVIPRLTTIQQPIEEIGELAAMSLHKLISKTEEVRREYILPHKLIIRESTAACTVAGN
jgi:LacI family transcriptional regulator